MKIFLVNILVIGISLLLNRPEALIKCERMLKFSENFLFGASSSAYQIEGGWNANGKGPSIWDTFTHNCPDLIADKSNGDVSIDSYHFYKNDIDALRQIGVKKTKHLFQK